MSFSARTLVYTAILAFALSPIVEAEPVSKEEALAALSQIEPPAAWASDFDMLMDMGEVSMKYAGTIKAKKDAFRMTVTMNMGGQTMVMTTILGNDGVQWTEMEMAPGMVQVMKLDLNEIDPALKASQSMIGGMGGPSSMGQNPGLMWKGAFEEFGGAIEVSEETIDGVAVYALEIPIDEETLSEIDSSGMMAAFGAGLERFRFLVGKQDGLMRKFEMSGPEGGMSFAMTLTNVDTESAIEDSEFEYTPPEGVMVMDMTAMMTMQGGAQEEAGGN